VEVALASLRSAGQQFGQRADRRSQADAAL